MKAGIVIPGLLLTGVEKWTPDFGQPLKCILPTHHAA